jgi:hypothetical protein
VSEEYANRPVPWITKEGALDAAKFPIEEEFMALAEDRSFSYKMRCKFKAATAGGSDFPAS